MKKQVVLAGILLAVVTLFLWRISRDGAEEPRRFLGYVEGETLYIGPNEEERLARLAVAAGSEVKPGDLLFVMNTALLERSRSEAAARIAQFEAQVQNLQAAMNRPQQIAVLQAALERAEASLKLSQEDYERQRKLYADGHVAKATLDRAVMARSRDEASVKEARRQVEVAQMASRSHEIDAAEASIKQARAQLQALDIRINRQSVNAPTGGVIQDVFFRPGEVVKAAQPVVALLPPENRKVRFYVPEPRLAGVKLGGRVKVACNGCPDGLYGRISFISGRQEYTPPVIFSDEERAKLVFKAEARLEGRAREAPLGLPVSVTVWPKEGGTPK